METMCLLFLHPVLTIYTMETRRLLYHSKLWIHTLGGFKGMQILYLTFQIDFLHHELRTMMLHCTLPMKDINFALSGTAEDLISSADARTDLIILRFRVA